MSRYLTLPKLPVPDLLDSLDRFLKAMKPLTTQTQFSQLVRTTKSFSERDGVYLQSKLLRFAEETDNWASRVWVDTRYLSNRNSLLFTNGKTTPRTKINWSTKREMLLAISQHLVRLVRLLEAIRDEKLPQETSGNAPLSMSQYKRLVGGYRVPKPEIDTHVFSPNSKHIVVMCAGRIYRMPVYNADGNTPLSIEELYQLLSQALESSGSCDETEGHAPISLLTSLERDRWHAAREELILHSPVNANSLREIEGSLFGLCIDECTARDESECIKLITFGDIRDNCKCYNRWNGLGLQTIFTKDGLLTYLTEHSMLDGMLIAFYGAIPEIKDMSTDPILTLSSALKVDLLKWDISRTTREQIETVKSKLYNWFRDYDSFSLDFTGFGKDLIKNYGVYYLGFIQLAIQLAYYKLCHQLTGTYQTVSLKSYREGRLEHPIVVSEEMMTFVESMTVTSSTGRERWKLLLKAINKYKQLLSDTNRGHVFVKHMSALKLLAEREQIPVELFQNSHFKVFMEPKLAISSIYTPLRVIGTFPLFSGHFIGLHPMTDCIHIFITCIPSRTSITSFQLYKQIESSLYALRDLMVAEGHAGLTDSKL